VRDYFEQFSRRGIKLLVFRRGLCIEYLQHHDIHIEQDRCGFRGCNWEKKKKTFIDHWEKVHAPKTLKCDFPNCLSTAVGTEFNQFGLDQHKRRSHGSKDHFCQEAGCTKKGPYTKDRLAQHMYGSHTGPIFPCDFDGCPFVVRTFKQDLLTHQASCHGKNSSRLLGTRSAEQETPRNNQDDQHDDRDEYDSHENFEDYVEHQGTVQQEDLLLLCSEVSCMFLPHLVCASLGM
jgi:hypothetical protein